MALTNLHTNWENGSYANDRNKFLKEKENPNLAGGGSYGLTPYFDGSIAIGYGYDLLVHTNAQINSLLTSMGMQPLSTADATLLDQARAQVNAGTATPTYLRDDVASQLTLTLPNEPVAAAMLDTMLNQYETALDTALGGHDQLGDSKERAAIISLLYTMTTPTSAAISATIPSTIKAIINDNRAEAWYGIRYGSNADGQHASRRYAEAHFFGLYDSGSTFTDPNEAKEVMRMYTKHKFEIVTYEINYPPSSNGNYASIDTDIAPAKNYLISTFGQGQSIGNVIVGKGLDSYVYQEQSSLDKIIGTTYNDLIFGEKGSDILDGGAGEDVIYGGEGNDMITGGQGNDYLEGGAGNDIYYINTGDGTDTIEDKEGNNRVIVNGKEVGLLIKQDDGTYKNPDGKIKATIEGTDLVLYDTVTGAKVTVLNENFQDGDFGIHLLEAPDSPQTNIVGDLTPIDFDPTIEGIQTKTDVWGNVIVDPKNPYPNRNDMLYDTSGNDRIEAGGGEDYIEAKHGGNDWLLGNSGSDVLHGGAGDDQLFGESSGDMETLIVDGEVAQGTGGRGDLAAGAEGNDLVYGANGNDTLLGGDGHDLLVGGGGDDIIFGDKDLTAAFPGWSTTVESAESIEGGVWSGFNSYTIHGINLGWVEDTFKGDDVIYAGAGNDLVTAGGGGDEVYGGLGDDAVFGEGGDDFIEGGEGNDHLTGDLYPTLLPIAEHGDDYIDGGAGDDKIRGGGGNDDLFGGDGNDLIHGDYTEFFESAGDDYIDGEAGDDWIRGNGGNDTIYGGEGNDWLQGDDGDDYIDGEAGNDTLIGGKGSDIFRFDIGSGQDIIINEVD